VATDAGTPPAVANEQFTITVAETNGPPVVSPVAPQTIEADGVLIVDVDASDRDAPAQTLTYSLETAPAGASIDPASGVVTWSPTSEQADQTHLFTVRVTDDGAQPANSTTSFSVIVRPSLKTDQPPVFTRVPVVLWVKGRSHSLTVEALDPDGDPVALAAGVAAASGSSFADLGGGRGRFDWDPSAASAGLYNIPLTATANEKSASAVLKIRVEDDNLYWSWAQDAFGELGEDFDLSQLSMDADIDGDGRTNLHEMALLTDPLVKDTVPLGFGIRFQDPFASVHLRVHRRKGADEFVDLGVRMSPTLSGDDWVEIPRNFITESIDKDGDDDGRTETESVDFDFLQYYPDGRPRQYFYQLEATDKP